MKHVLTYFPHKDDKRDVVQEVFGHGCETDEDFENYIETLRKAGIKAWIEDDWDHAHA